MQTQLNNREARLTAIRLIADYKFHSKESGFLEWKENTPQHVKELELELERTNKCYNTVICP